MTSCPSSVQRAMVPAQMNSASSGCAITTAIFFGPDGSSLVSAASRATCTASASMAADGSLGAASESVSLIPIPSLPLSLLSLAARRAYLDDCARGRGRHAMGTAIGDTGTHTWSIVSLEHGLRDVVRYSILIKKLESRDFPGVCHTTSRWE